MSQAGQLDAADVLQRQIGNVHVQYRTRWQFEIRMGLDQFARKVGRRGQVVDLSRDQRKGKGGTRQEATFECRRHGTRVQHVVPQVGAQVDAGHHHVRLTFQQAVEAQVHAIGRRTVDADKAIGQRVRM
ncbi:hypothetical protein D3C78_1563120 [compost metagenome]